MVEGELKALYERLLRAWNARSAEGMAALFREDGYTVGFDGTLHDGRDRIRREVGEIFASHPTASFVARVRGVMPLASGVAVLHGVAGMIQPGGSGINPATNAIQTLVAVREGSDWCIAVFHNTPAGYHGRPEAAAALTAELQEVADRGVVVG
jgi:uncharacterized protein (TIGR02246 family)